ncbi:MAG: hypothetical protein O9264_07085 [Leptospira sp.]|nr:hypothetical protein [Leptospira sp.]
MMGISFKWKVFSKFVFITIFCFNFALQKILDNEANCGILGAPESTCPYAFLDHVSGTSVDHSLEEHGEHEDHVCLSCPCNLQLSVSWNLNLYHITVNLNYLYIQVFTPVLKTKTTAKAFFRPPRLIFS